MELNKKQLCLFAIVQILHGEERKYNGGPYWEHVVRVGNMVNEFELDFRLGWEVGLCHDLIEDKKCTSDELINHLVGCGYTLLEAESIVNHVQELSNEYSHESYPTINRAERKRLEASRLHRVSYVAATVKYADIIDNLPSTVNNDPEFGVKYWVEKMNIVEGMRHGNFDLLVRCCAVLNDCRIILTEKGYL